MIMKLIYQKKGVINIKLIFERTRNKTVHQSVKMQDGTDGGAGRG